MSFLTDWLASVFGGEDPEQPTGPILGKRRTSDTREQREKKKRRLAERYEEQDYQMADLYDGQQLDRYVASPASVLLERESKVGTLRLSSATGPRPAIVPRRILRPKSQVEKVKEQTRVDSVMGSLPPTSPKFPTVEDEEILDDSSDYPDMPLYPIESTTVKPVTQPTTPSASKTKEPSIATDSWSSTDPKKSSNSTARSHLRAQNFNVETTKALIKYSLAKSGAQPDYVFQDVEIRDGVWSLMDSMERFATKYFAESVYKVNGSDLKGIFNSLLPETVKVIGCVASGGPGGAAGWRAFFTEDQKRRALVNAIIGNVIVEQVFQHAFFGGSDNQRKMLELIQKTKKNQDGFDRNESYAQAILDELKPNRNVPGDKIHLPSGFNAHAKVVTTGIYLHLTPLLRAARIPNFKSAQEDLYKIVAKAGILSLLMRADPHTVYYFVPTFKEDTFTSKHMECFNRNRMTATNPRERKTWPEGISEAEKSRRKNDEALTQITIMDGITAYRRGGWETATSTPQNPEYQEDNGADMGIRSRILTHGWVYCRWGRPRKFDKGNPADVAELHGEEWKEPGFIEFSQVPGVPQPPKTKNKTKGKARVIPVEKPPTAAVAEASGTRRSLRPRGGTLAGPSK